MTIIQIHNVFTYMGIILLDGNNKLISISPDYIKEKASCLLGQLGKNEFVEYPIVKYDKHQYHHDRLKDTKKFWKTYSKIWHIDDDDFELMNLINFLLNVRPPYDKYDNKNKGDVLKYFEKYIGDIEYVPVYDLSCKAHFKISEYLNKHIDFNDRFFKLKILCTKK